MDKETLLQQIAQLLATGELTKAELINRFGLSIAAAPTVTPTPPTQVANKPSRWSVTNTLYMLGASIALIGLGTFIAQLWDDIDSLGRITVTLGLGLLITTLGIILSHKQVESNLVQVFHCLGGLLVPGGVMVMLHEFKLDTEGMFAIAFIGLTIFYLSLTIANKVPVLTFFTVANGTAALYLTINAVLGNTATETLYQYLTMVIGASYLLLGHSFAQTWNRGLVRVAYFFGSVGLLGASFAQVFDSGFWELLYFVFIGGGFYLSIFLHSRIILVISTMFLVAHIIYITGEYFADSLGWPVMLVVLGFVFIGLGYVSWTISNRYIASTE